MKKGLYKGFSFHEFVRSRTFAVNDLDLVKLDLLNYIYTRKGSRYHMPSFGTNLHDLTFEVMDDELIGMVEDELTAAVLYDPRVQLLSVRMMPNYDDHSLTAEIMLLYLELNMKDVMYLNIDFTQFQ